MRLVSWPEWLTLGMELPDEQDCSGCITSFLGPLRGCMQVASEDIGCGFGPCCFTPGPWSSSCSLKEAKYFLG